MSEIEGGNARGRPTVKWRDRVQECVRERGERSLRNFEQARRECLDREREMEFFCCGHLINRQEREKGNITAPSLPEWALYLNRRGSNRKWVISKP